MDEALPVLETREVAPSVFVSVNVFNGEQSGEAASDALPSEDAVARAFTEWDRRWREEPERFMSEAEHLLKEDPETYGEACAPYFLQLLREQL